MTGRHRLLPLNSSKFHLGGVSENLKLIQKLVVGVNTIDLEVAKKRGIAGCNLSGVNSNEVAEFTIGMMLSAGQADCIPEPLDL